MNDHVDLDGPVRRAALAQLAIAAAVLAYMVAATLGPMLGTEAIWPFDRIGLILAALAGVEAIASRITAAGT